MTLVELLEEAYKQGFDDGHNRWGYYSDGSMHELLSTKGIDPDMEIEQKDGC